MAVGVEGDYRLMRDDRVKPTNKEEDEIRELLRQQQDTYNIQELV
jgi:hypothetical protein